jgi:hypothetical protein
MSIIITIKDVLKFWIVKLPKIVWATMLFLQFAQSQTMRGTTVVLVIRDTVAYLGADSRGISDRKESVDTICKIVACGNRIIGIKDIGVFYEPFGEVTKILMHSMRQFPSDGVLQSIRRLDSTWSNALLADYGSGRSPARFTRIGFLACEYTDGAFDYFQVSYVVDTTGPIPRVDPPRVFPGRQRSAVIPFGFKDSIEALYKINKPFFIGTNPVVLLNSLIRIQAVKSPRYVGGPVNIVGLNKDGSWWVQGKKRCEPCDDK